MVMRWPPLPVRPSRVPVPPMLVVEKVPSPLPGKTSMRPLRPSAMRSGAAVEVDVLEEDGVDLGGVGNFDRGLESAVAVAEQDGDAGGAGDDEVELAVVV